jgi:hypothetical protein
MLPPQVLVALIVLMLAVVIPLFAVTIQLSRFIHWSFWADKITRDLGDESSADRGQGLLHCRDAGAGRLVLGLWAVDPGPRAAHDRTPRLLAAARVDA